MKVSNYSATATNIEIILEAEHPAEVAMLALMLGCQGQLRMTGNAEDDAQSRKIAIDVEVKKSGSRY